MKFLRYHKHVTKGTTQAKSRTEEHALVRVENIHAKGHSHGAHRFHHEVLAYF